MPETCNILLTKAPYWRKFTRATQPAIGYAVQYDAEVQQAVQQGWIRLVGAPGSHNGTPIAESITMDFGEPPPRFDHDQEAGLDELREAIELEEEAAARTAAEYAVIDVGHPIRVAHLHNYFGLGGAEWGLYTFATATDQAVCRHEGLAGRPACDLVTWFPEHGIPVNVYDGRTSRTEWFLRQVEGVDIVEYTLPKVWETYPEPPEYVGLVSTRVNCRLGEWCSHLDRQPDLLLPLSPAARHCLGDVHPEVPRVIVPYGATPGRRGVTAARKSVRERLGIAADETVAIWCGRLGAVEKDVPLLRRAVEETPGLTWIVIGYWFQPHSEEAQQWEAWCSGQPVHWVRGCRPWEVREYYYAADIATSTSSTEGLGITMLDGAAAGLPIVATDSGGCRHIVIGGANGWLSPSGLDSSFLANLREMVELDQSTRLQMGRSGMELVKARFDPTVLAQRRVVEYAHIAARTRAKRIARPSASVVVNHGRLPKRKRQARVAFVFDRPAIGGMPWRAALTAHGLREMGHEVTFFYHATCDGELDMLPWLESEGIGYSVDPAGTALVDWSPDVVQLGWPPLVATHRGGWRTVGWVGGPRAIQSLLGPNACSRVDAFVYVSESLFAELPQHVQDKAVLVRNALPGGLTDGLNRQAARTRLGLGRHDFAVLWAGARLTDENKRLADALAVVELVPRMRLIVAGDATSCRYRAAQLRATDRVILADGLRPWEMPSAYAAVDAVLQTSGSEGLSLVALEAAQAGLPLVATSVGGTVELLAGTGLLYQVGDVRTAAAALARLRDEPSRRRRIGAGLAARVAAEYDWREYLTAYSDLYNRLAKEAG